MPSAPQQPKVVFLSAISSDIGIALAQRYARDGYVVCGTYRSGKLLDQLKRLDACHLFFCDLRDPASIEGAVAQYRALDLPWETFISCACNPLPVTGFFAADFDRWQASVEVNTVAQFRVLHALYPLRRPGGENQVVFFAGGGTNNAVKNFSAYTVSKIMQIKFCELLDAECPDLNTFIVGPGWTRTKTHDLILSDPQVSPEKLAETQEFLRHKEGTPMDDIYDCIRWLSRQGRTVAGGRNFSVVHDSWGSDALAAALKADPHMYKLRRSGNDWREREEKKDERCKGVVS